MNTYIKSIQQSRKGFVLDFERVLGRFMRDFTTIYNTKSEYGSSTFSKDADKRLTKIENYKAMFVELMTYRFADVLNEKQIQVFLERIRDEVEDWGDSTIKLDYIMRHTYQRLVEMVGEYLEIFKLSS